MIGLKIKFAVISRKNGAVFHTMINPSLGRRFGFLVMLSHPNLGMLRSYIPAVLFSNVSLCLFQELPSVLDCTIPQNTEAITPEEREELKVSVKLFLSEADCSAIGNAVDMACVSLGVSQLDSVIIAPPPLPEGETLALAHLQPLWEELEGLVRSQKVAAIGTSDLDKALLEQLYNWAQVKPSSNQVNLASCCVMPPDLTAFAKEFDIQLLTHNDSKEMISAEGFKEAVQESSKDLQVADWRLEWVLRYSIIVKSRGIIKAKGYLVHSTKNSQ
uniref:Glutamate--cysteine ligase regulatory subunit n=1 Tax=Astyanax mexicanus TaxID=7994 RepID=A0A8B9HV37_ASTMX